MSISMTPFNPFVSTVYRLSVSENRYATFSFALFDTCMLHAIPVYVFIDRRPVHHNHRPQLARRSHHLITLLSITHRRRRLEQGARGALVERCHRDRPNPPIAPAALVVWEQQQDLEMTRVNQPHLPYPLTHPLKSMITTLSTT